MSSLLVFILMNDDSNEKLLSEQVPEHLAGKRLDQALALMFPQSENLLMS